LNQGVLNLCAQFQLIKVNNTSCLRLVLQGCIFAPSISLLITFRALQGTAAAGYGATGSAIIADVYAPHERGTAMGISTTPMVGISRADACLHAGELFRIIQRL
jgi:hypothetical protein